MWAQYQAFAVLQAQEYMNNGVRTTCEDLPLNIMIDFASENGLPFEIVNEAGTFNASSEMYNNVSDFRNMVLATTGANDLRILPNTVPVDRENLSVGDLILQVNDYGRATHTQLVTSRTANSIGIHQGSFRHPPLGVANPEGMHIPVFTSTFGLVDVKILPYIGGNVQLGTYTRSGKTGYIYRREGQPKRPSVWENSRLRRWNYQAWGSGQ
jgi:hypothetical protein